MSDFFRHEAYLRPILPVDPDQESIIIRRGELGKPRVLYGYAIEEEHILIKRGGVVSNIPWIYTETVTIIDPGETKAVAEFDVTRSRQIKIDIDSMLFDDTYIGVSYLMLLRITDMIEWNKFAILGDRIPHGISATKVGGKVLVNLTNTHNNQFTVMSRVIA